MNNTINVTIYTVDACPKCDETKAGMAERNVSPTVINMSQDNEIRMQMRSRGFRQAPIVILTNEFGEEISNWSGFDEASLNLHFGSPTLKPQVDAANSMDDDDFWEDAYSDNSEVKVHVFA